MARQPVVSQAQVNRVNKALERLGNSKTVNQVVVKAARLSAKTYLLKPSIKAVPVKTGALRKATKVRSLKRSRNGAGVRVGFAAKDFTGDFFYGSFIEYGHRIGKRELGPARKQVKAKRPLARVAQSHGKQAADLAAKLIADALEKMAKK